MIAFDIPADFDVWRDQAKAVLQAQVPPEQVHWGAATLFGSELPVVDSAAEVRVPAEFAKLAQTVFMHSDPGRLDLLYRLLWRVQSNRFVLQDATDPDVVKIELLVKGIRRDIHKMRAFVRFREVAVEGEAGFDSGPVDDQVEGRGLATVARVVGGDLHVVVGVRRPAVLDLDEDRRRVGRVEHRQVPHLPVAVARVRVVGVLDRQRPVVVEGVTDLGGDLVVGEVGQERERPLGDTHRWCSFRAGQLLDVARTSGVSVDS